MHIMYLERADCEVTRCTGIYDNVSPPTLQPPWCYPQHIAKLSAKHHCSHQSNKSRTELWPWTPGLTCDYYAILFQRWVPFEVFEERALAKLRCTNRTPSHVQTSATTVHVGRQCMTPNECVLRLSTTFLFLKNGRLDRGSANLNKTEYRSMKVHESRRNLPSLWKFTKWQLSVIIDIDPPSPPRLHHR